LLGEALVAARDLTNEWPRAGVLSGLAAHLPEPLLGEALVSTIHGQWVPHDRPTAERDYRYDAAGRLR
jgi:hypothetical protein